MYKPKKLFGSGARVKLLKIFLTANPDTEFFGRDIVRRSGLQINSVRLELKNLEQLQILKSRIDYPKILYRVNQNNEKIESLRNLVL